MGSRRTRIRWVRLLGALPLMWVVYGLGMATPGYAAPSAAPEDGCLQEPTCSGHYQKALSLYESGRYEAALPEFQAAYESRQMPWLLINIGRTFHRLGRLDEAITLYNRYEHAVPNGDLDTLKKVREYKAQAEVLLAAKSATTAPDLVAPVPVVTKSTAAEPKPLYKKWWFWTAIGGGVAVIAITGIAIGVATQTSSPAVAAPYPPGTPVYHPMF